MSHTKKDLHQFTTATIIDCLPENYPLVKDSGLWQIWNDDIDEVIFRQDANQTFEEFIREYALSILNGEYEADFETLATNLAFEKSKIGYAVK